MSMVDSGVWELYFTLTAAQLETYRCRLRIGYYSMACEGKGTKRVIQQAFLKGT
jgi:hypothetical protein